MPSVAERSRFAAFLQHGYLTIDVYDGDSLLLLGVAKVPLAVSLRDFVHLGILYLHTLYVLP